VLIAAVNDPTLGSPGLAGFLATFGLALATWLLMRSMVGRLRRVRYGPDPSKPDGADQTGDGAPGAGADGGGATGEAETGRTAAENSSAKDVRPGG
jgi:hypothetical protein